MKKVDMLRLEKKRWGQGIIAVFKYLKDFQEEHGKTLFSPAREGRMHGNKAAFSHEKFTNCKKSRKMDDGT